MVEKLMFTKIKKIDKYAVFNNFDWNATVSDKGNNVVEFKDINIIYGRNYSGKTTLSRIFRSLEKGKLNEKYPNATFEFEHTGADRMCHLDVANCSYDIRVYNRDYISENLKLLTDEGGTIQPFAILGESNVAIENEIAEKEKILGSETEETGLKFELKNKTDAYVKKKSEKDSAESALDSKLRTKANQSIKTNPIYNDVNYTITKIKADIEKIVRNKIQLLEEDEVESKKKLLKEESKDNISPISKYNASFNSLYEKAEQLLAMEIKPTKSIQELLNNHLLQEWVRDGIEHHKNKRTKCAFCGAVLPEDLWDKLDVHFSKESEILRQNLKSLIVAINAEKEATKNISSINEEQLYSSYQAKLKSQNKILGKEIKKYLDILDSLIADVDDRIKNIFQTKSIVQLTDNSSSINECIDEINKLIDKHDEKSTSLIEDQRKARDDLRLNEVGTFIRDIDYAGELEKISNLADEEAAKLKDKQETADKIKELEKRIAELKTRMKDESQGAEKVNEYLNHYFGHKGLRLAAVEGEDESGVTFRILRGDEEAHNLSEGECSLVAFCYFIARLEDIETKNKELIIWIDDPVSSLDYNHIFFIFSLIESVLARPYKKDDGSNGYHYKQLFISTHNLDFLKYLKRLSRARKKEESQYFLIDIISEKESKIRVMPDYLKNYITEFNYLFHQIYKCTQVENANEEHECFYNFGNNLRKFLEAYLFYKYPVQQDIKDKLSLFFKEDQAAIDLTNRLDNELSHLEEIFDRSMRPIEIPEIPKLANYVLAKVKEKDRAQYDALLKSIGEL
jgi:wobble nucleotide-excising tRNase